MEAAVCRVVIAVLLYAGGACPAPQDSSAITYVRPFPEDGQAPPGPALRESRVENLPLVIGGIFNETKIENSEQLSSVSQEDISTPTVQRVTREDATTSSYESDTPTERVSDEAEPTEASLPKPQFPSPRFTSKLSYFHKASGLADTNLVERTGKRKFRSRCRCEKIWNCPKLQITVPRCPEEYFMCCF